MLVLSTSCYMSTPTVWPSTAIVN
ncbi:MAG: hypothetical protein JWN35_1514, partial [Frankiales bacterium]|nr:hypothetical protein [Frankiales bacterium]